MNKQASIIKLARTRLESKIFECDERKFGAQGKSKLLSMCAVVVVVTRHLDEG